MSVWSPGVVESRRNSKLFLLIPEVQSNHLGFSIPLRVYWIHSRQLQDVHCVHMGCGYADVGNHTGILDPTRKAENRIDIQSEYVFGSNYAQFLMRWGLIMYIPGRSHMRPWIS